MASAKIFGCAIHVEAEDEDGGGSSIAGEVSRSGIQPDYEAMNLSVCLPPINQRENTPYFRFLESNSDSGSDCMDSEPDPRNRFIDFFDRESHDIETAEEFYIIPTRRVSAWGDFDVLGFHETEEDTELGLRIGSGAGQLRGDSGGVVTGNMETDSGRVEGGTGLTPVVDDFFGEEGMAGAEVMVWEDLQNGFSWVEEPPQVSMDDDEDWQMFLAESNLVIFEEAEDIMVDPTAHMDFDFGILLDSMYEFGENQVEFDAVVSRMLDNDEYGVVGSPPASKSAVDRLPVVKITSEELSKGNMVCAICKDEIVAEERIKTLPCRHYYHGECIVPWLGMRNTCPVCRYELPTDDVDYERFRRSQRRRGGSSGLARDLMSE
uniref:RING-type E3 ubiquitin transferase n=1 Tax=Noccaea caerulescens TaxID=107243 RepID=A0A1J3HCF8_NOCCA